MLAGIQLRFGVVPGALQPGDLRFPLSLRGLERQDPSPFVGLVPGEGKRGLKLQDLRFALGLPDARLTLPAALGLVGVVQRLLLPALGLGGSIDRLSVFLLLAGLLPERVGEVLVGAGQRLRLSSVGPRGVGDCGIPAEILLGRRFSLGLGILPGCCSLLVKGIRVRSGLLPGLFGDDARALQGAHERQGRFLQLGEAVLQALGVGAELPQCLSSAGAINKLLKCILGLLSFYSRFA